MSNEAINWAFAQDVPKSSAKFVLVAMANLAGADMTCWPSMQYLQNATGQDRKTVLESTRRLREAGFVVDTGERKGVTKGVVVYRLSDPKNGTASEVQGDEEGAAESVGSSAENGIAKQSQKRSGSENGVVPFFPGSSPVFPVKQSQISLEAVPKTGHRTIKEPSRNPKDTTEKSADRVDLLVGVSPQVIADYLQVRKAKRAGALTATAVAGLEREAVKVGLSLAQAVAYCCEAGWQGFNAGWYSQRQGTGKQTSRHSGFDQRNYEGAPDGSIPA